MEGALSSTGRLTGRPMTITDFAWENDEIKSSGIRAEKEVLPALHARHSYQRISILLHLFRRPCRDPRSGDTIFASRDRALQ
jgi:hypothetical protein